MSDARELITKAVAEVGAAALLGIIREGVTKVIAAPDSPAPSVRLAERVQSILGERLQSEIAYDAAIRALRGEQ